MKELHLIVLWEFARTEEARILADVSANLTVVYSCVLSWPADPLSCFTRFYGANLDDARAKVVKCGGGPFRVIIVRDENPTSGFRETSRGLERVNERMFDLKMKYRSWTGGGHKVHTTNSPEEFARDVLLLTGRPAVYWETVSSPTVREVLSGHDGWPTLRDLFAFLGQAMPYAVLRNAEMLPDAFDPSVHGDIDLLVPDAEKAACALGARKVFPESTRVHYEVQIAGRPVRLDLRMVGDDYYDARWEAEMLARRVPADGHFLLSPEDAFYALVYHAVYQKYEIASDYPQKARALAEKAGVAGKDFDDWILALEAFLDRKGYSRPRPLDVSVRWNERTLGWRTLAAEIAALSGATEIRPFKLEEVSAHSPLKTFFFTCVFEGRPCFVKHSPVARKLTAAEWSVPLLVAQARPDLFARPLFWHTTRDGGAVVFIERIEGRRLDDLVARGDSLLMEKAATMAADMRDIALELKRAGIVHRDIRPANLLVTAEGHVKLIDFQFAIPLGPVPEDPITDAYPRILHVLGDRFALGRGQWNDRYSMRLCLNLLPPSSARDAAIAALEAEGCTQPDKTASCGRRRMKWARRRLARLRRRKFWARWFARPRAKMGPEFDKELETLEAMVSYWSVI